jgi:hypothetical protein
VHAEGGEGSTVVALMQADDDGRAGTRRHHGLTMRVAVGPILIDVLDGWA